MKNIFLIILIISLVSVSYGEIIRIKKSTTRTVSPEPISFQLLYLGTCDQFFSIEKITIGSLVDSCLPINSTFQDIDNLSAHVLCTNIARNRAQIDFVEIFETYPTVVTNFIISFATNAPFRALAENVAYVRRPSCEIEHGYCTTDTYIDSCTENPVQFLRGFVISKDVVYIVPNGAVNLINGCRSSPNTCCSYVTPGFCPRTADNSIFRIKYNQRPQHGHYDDHRNGRPSFNDHQNNHFDKKLGKTDNNNNNKKTKSTTKTTTKK